MFQIQDTVFYPSGGICVIDDIRVVAFEGLPERNYYIIHPIRRPQDTFFVPVDSDRIKLRHLISRRDALDLLDHVTEIAPIEESNLRTRKERIVESLEKYECIEWLRVIRTVYRHRETLMGKSKRISDTERSYADTARQYLYTELSAALEIPFEEVEACITRHAQAAEQLFSGM